MWQGVEYEEIEKGVFKYTHIGSCPEPPRPELHLEPREHGMGVLSEMQIVKGYFGIGGFTNIGEFDTEKILKEFKDYNGEERVCIACTQLESHHAYARLKKSEHKRILQEWVDFLSTNTKALKVLRFNSHVPQALFNAACCQENLEALRCKWGSYSDLSALENLNNLKFLYLGDCSRVQDITALGKIESLVVLRIQAFNKIDDFSPLVTLDNLEQLVILGPVSKNAPMKDLEFLREMPNLRSILFGVKLGRKYTAEELANLRAALPNLYDIGDYVFKGK